MSNLIIFLLSIVKHFCLTTVVDAGYSSSRQRRNRKFVFPLLRHVLLEAAVSAWLLRHAAYCSLMVFVIVESLAQVLLCLIERRSPHHRLLRTYLLCETSLIALYAVLVLLLRPFG